MGTYSPQLQASYVIRGTLRETNIHPIEKGKKQDLLRILGKYECRKKVLQKGKKRKIERERGGELEGTGFSTLVMDRIREQGKRYLD